MAFDRRRVATAVALLVWPVVVWWVIPLRRRVRDGSRGAEGDHDLRVG